MIDYTEAVRLAYAGEIEGVCTSHNRLRYVRRLAQRQRQEPSETEHPTHRQRSQPLNAVTNLGAYRQHLEHGAIWALCMCRGLDGART